MRALATATDTSFGLGRHPRKDPVPYSKEALRQDLLRVRNAREDCQASRDRNAIYRYLTAVFDLVMWWAAEGRAVSRARWALRLQGLDVPTNDEPFAAVTLCTADRQKVDKRTRSKWSRVLRYAMEYKTNAEPLAAFVQRKGGINKCAARFARCFGAEATKLSVEPFMAGVADMQISRIRLSDKTETSTFRCPFMLSLISR